MRLPTYQRDLKVWQWKSQRRRPPGNRQCQKSMSAKKCQRCFAHAVCRNSHQEKCSIQTQPIEEPVRDNKMKRFERSTDEDRMPPNKLKPVKRKKDKMLKKKGKLQRKNKAFFMNHQNLHCRPPSSAINKRKLYIPLSPRAISCQPWTMIASIPSFGV